MERAVLTKATGKKKARKHSGKKFLDEFDVLWQEGPKVEYRNPDSWID